MGYFAEGEAWIPMDAWTDFVSKFLPANAQDACLRLGIPLLRDDELVVPFAVNTECDPIEQAAKPAFMAMPSLEAAVRAYVNAVKRGDDEQAVLGGLFKRMEDAL